MRFQSFLKSWNAQQELFGVKQLKDGHMYGFKNWDFNQCARPHIVILDIQLKNGPHMIGFSEAGQIMRDGFSSNGIAILANNLQSVNDHAGYGLPVTVLEERFLHVPHLRKQNNLF